MLLINTLLKQHVNLNEFFIRLLKMLVKNKLLLAAAFLIGVLVVLTTAESEKVVEPLVGFVGPDGEPLEFKLIEQGKFITAPLNYVCRSLI